MSLVTHIGSSITTISSRCCFKHSSAAAVTSGGRDALVASFLHVFFWVLAIFSMSMYHIVQAPTRAKI